MKAIATSPISGIRRATDSDLASLVDLLTDAFTVDGPVGPWLMPSVELRKRKSRAYFRTVVGAALSSGWVDVIDSLDAVSIWYPIGSGEQHTNFAAAASVERADATLEKLAALDRALSGHRPTGTPHHHLVLLVTRPDCRRAGLGSALIQHHHHYLDVEGIPSYTEALSASSRRLYGRNGYTSIGAVRLNSGLAAWPMWRQPTFSVASE